MKKGELLHEYDSLAEAAKISGINKAAICNNCNGKTKSSGGYIQSYLKEGNPIKPLAYRTKAVIQLSLDDKEINSYESLTEASKATGVGISSITSACKGKYKTAGGYKWKYKE